MSPSGISLADLTVCHGRRPAVHHLSGRFAPGSLTAVVGPNEPDAMPSGVLAGPA